MKTVFQWKTNDQVNLIAVDDYPFAIQVDDGVMLPADGGLELEVTREFVTQRGDHVEHARFSDFVTTPPLKGLGVDMALIDRIVGTDDPDLLRLLRDAEKVGKGRRTDLEPSADSAEGLGNGSSDYVADRLARQHPEQYEAVKSGKLTLNAAAVLAGIRPRRISVRLDNAGSLARSLRKHLTPEQLAELRAVLDGDT